MPNTTLGRFFARHGGLRLVRTAARTLWSEGPAELVRRALRVLRPLGAGAPYDHWAQEHDRFADAMRPSTLALQAKFAHAPRISIIVPTAMDSLAAQTYPHWEVCPELALATGEFVCWMDPGDVIPADALFELVAELNRNPAADMVYSDEDRIDAEGRRFDPFFKPDWSPDYLESCPYTGRLGLYRRTLAQEVGGLRSDFDGAQDYDFVLRFTERTTKIAHVPRVLCHRRERGSSDAVAARALEERLVRTGRRGSARPMKQAGCFEVRWALPRAPLVSIVIPTAGGDRMVRGKKVNLVTYCVERIRSGSSYSNYEIVIVDNGDLRSEVRLALERSGCRRVTFTEPAFNISKKINLGAAQARGEFLLLLNDDIDLINADWIEALLEQALKPGVGAVGAKLLYENGTTQHVGVVHHRGLPDHVRKHFPREDPGYQCSSVAVRNYLAVTGACMLTGAEAFRAVGGFEEAFKINYSDIDYCLKLRERGLRAVYTPHAELYHYESSSRKAEVAQEEIDLFLQRWRAVTMKDPYYNGDYLQTAPADFSLNLHADRRDRRHVPA